VWKAFFAFQPAVGIIKKKLPKASLSISTAGALSTGLPLLFLVLVFRIGQLRFGPPTPRTAFENVTVMEQAIEHRCDRRAVAQQLAPVFHWSFRSQQSAGAFIAPHDDLVLLRRWAAIDAFPDHRLM